MKNNQLLVIGAILAGLYLFRKNLGIGSLKQRGKKFRYISKGMKKFATITASEIMNTDYWPNELDDSGNTISNFVNNGYPGDTWKNNIETITRIK